MDANVKIIDILNKFGMTGVKAADVMGISQPLFKAKKGYVNGNSFSDDNYQTLRSYIIKTAAGI